MIGNVLKKIFGSKNERELNKLRPIVEQINALEPEMQALSDDQLRAKTQIFKEQIDQGATLDELLPEAFAVVREASVRTLKMRHFDVQLIGGIVLHQGKIAEMKTGEGKTLAATLPAYLNALTGRGVHVVTVNDYLARRDTEWMGSIYRFLGLSVGTVVHGLDDPQRQAAYNADITYGTNNEFGFDYLRDNMKFSLESMVQRDLHYAIVDEVDSILVDEARTPLIISGPVEYAGEKLYEEVKPQVIKLKRHQDRLIHTILDEAVKRIEEEGEGDGVLELLLKVKRGDPKNLRFLDLIAKRPGIKKKLEKLEGQLSTQKLLPQIDQDLFCTIEENQNLVELTEKGLKLIYGGHADDYIVPDLDEELRKIDENDQLTSMEKRVQRRKAEAFYREASERFHVTRQLIKAYWLFDKDVHYVVKDGQVIIVDEFTGRMMPGRRWSDGLHQAVEAKEGVTVAGENQTLATITFQNYFRMYQKLAGMTGTADTEAAEFKKIYDLDVLVIPTNEPMIRIDYPDVIYKTEAEKFKAVVEEIKQLHKKGQPVLVGTISIEKSEKLSHMLTKKKIKHEVLNAKNHEREAEIVALAGQKGHVTISTNMAGRGTDIVLGEGVKELGGLHIIGTERHESRRIDNQLRGRSGRQGDPGSSRFYLAMEDDLLRIFGGERMSSIMERLGMQEGEPIEHSMISKAIENAQRKVEGHNFEIRKQLLKYDDVMNQQREVIYKQRREALSGESLRPAIEEMIHTLSEKIADTFGDEKVLPEEWDMKGLREAVYQQFGFRLAMDRDTMDGLTRDGLSELIFESAMKIYDEREKTFGVEEFRQLEQMIMLQVVDNLWKEHLLAMDHLKEGIGLRGYAQQDPLVVYKQEGFEMFMDMIERIKEETVKFLFRVQISRPEEIAAKEKTKQDRLVYSHGGESAKQPVRRSEKKVGRNQPCPCGSGKKYKKCCGK
ncbi:MAG: preprotein translocase subunit SecA [Deltaproteobacteria bacterium]|nr:preprotein translocase subunit SecA [Deltaproteobacteria bacterium]MBW2019480.1 preprotein translocase subunit SecA [Deltaproteobacteria bacterium]MBW2074317.1 preprotein translocase subunit SecA [Deltaproteobacteria bacterium]RLB82151.1 MAG: preprotein translocase subunit SecA [Deltaproteobacteria bacterium]